jgi:hypothetical protein
LLPHARAAIEAAHQASRALARARLGAEGRLRMGLVAGTQTPLTSRVLSNVQRAVPGCARGPDRARFLRSVRGPALGRGGDLARVRAAGRDRACARATRAQAAGGGRLRAPPARGQRGDRARRAVRLPLAAA